MHFRDWSWKDEILIKHISNHIGACTCAQEPKTYAHGRKLEFKSQKLTCTACFWLKDIFLRLVMKRQNVYWTYCWPQKINPLNLTMHMHTLSKNLWVLAENMCVLRKDYVHGLLLIKKHISEIGDEKTKNVLNILLTTKNKSIEPNHAHAHTILKLVSIIRKHVCTKEKLSFTACIS